MNDDKEIFRREEDIDVIEKESFQFINSVKFFPLKLSISICLMWIVLIFLWSK